MYSLYRKQQENGSLHFVFEKNVSLFGCNNGFIPQLLKQKIPANQTEPFKWKLDISVSLMAGGYAGKTLVINLKPRIADNLSLYELVNVWGHSSSGWTPIMLHLRGLLVDKNPKDFDSSNFNRKTSEIDDPIFSLLYLSGTVKDGKINGKWTVPGASPTNSVLLWPETFSYFAEEAHAIINSKK